MPRRSPAATDGSDDVTLTVAGSAAVAGPPREAFVRVLDDYANKVFDRAKDEEWLYRGGSKAVEFNSQHFVQAERTVLRAGHLARRVPWWHTCFDILQPLLWLFAGLALSEIFVVAGWGWPLAFGLLVAAGIGTLATNKLYDRMASK